MHYCTKKATGPLRKLYPQFERQWLWMWSLRINPWCKTHDMYLTDGETTFWTADKFAALQRNVRLPIKTIVRVLFHKATAIVNQRGISIALHLTWSRKLSPVTRGTYLDGLPNSNTLCSNNFFFLRQHQWQQSYLSCVMFHFSFLKLFSYKFIWVQRSSRRIIRLRNSWTNSGAVKSVYITEFEPF